MVKWQLRARGIHDERVLRGDGTHPAPRIRAENPAAKTLTATARCAIQAEQTISQPYMVALMTQALHLQGHENVLEIGTGSGYQTALLCELVQHVYSIERVAAWRGTLADCSSRLGYTNYRHPRRAMAARVCADMAPFDAIIVTAAAPLDSRSAAGADAPRRRQAGDPGGRRQAAVPRTAHAAAATAGISSGSRQCVSCR